MPQSPTPYSGSPPTQATTSLDHYFNVSRRSSSVKTEVLAGIATFLAGMYIIVVNPAILSDAGIPFSAALSATVVISFFSSLAMGLYARNPILVAPGMGMNALFTYTLVLGAWCRTVVGSCFRMRILVGSVIRDSSAI